MLHLKCKKDRTFADVEKNTMSFYFKLQIFKYTVKTFIIIMKLNFTVSLTRFTKCDV